ncbi:MAG: hypothetical protein HFJ59_01920 [Clostridia bacterium]|nr:hypothetical protein [Clostridia bacterium]
MEFIFEEKLGNAKRGTTDKDIQNLEEALSYLTRYIKEIQKQLNNDKYIKNYIISEFEEQLKTYLKIGKNSLMGRELEALNVFKGNPHILKKYYDLLKDEDLENFDRMKEKEQLNGNEEDREIFEMKVIIQEVRKHKSIVSPELILRVKREYDRQKVKTKDMREYYNFIIIFDQKSEEEMIKMYANYRKSELDKIFQKQEQQKLIQAGIIFSKYGLLEVELQKINQDYELLGMPELKYQKRATEEGDIGLEEIFEEEYVKGLNEEQLAILNSFWQNRLTKKLQSINQAILTIETLDLWNKILLGKKISKISNEQLRNIIYKSKICASCYDSMKKYWLKEINTENNLLVTLVNANVVGAKFKEKYYKYFDKVFPKGRNDFCKEFSLLQPNKNLIENVYNTKYYKIEELLLNIETNSNITNWGYIPDKHRGKNSLQAKKRFIIIAIDYPGFNNTVMLHIDRKQLIKFFLNVKERTIMPIYEGDKSEIYKEKSRGRQILMPLTEKRESAIISLNREVNATDGRYQYITHLGNLITKKIRKKVKRIYPSRYVDLLTGQEGNKINGEFIPESKKIMQVETEKNIDN